MKMNGSALEINLSFKMLGWLSLLKRIRALTLSLLVKLPPRKLEPWFCISKNLPYVYARNTVLAGASGCYLELLNKLQKRISRTVSPSLAASLEMLVNLFYRYYFGRCSYELFQLVLLPYTPGRSTRYSNKLHDFSVTIPRCYKDVYANSFFPCTARLWNSLPIEYFPLIYDLSGFKSRINRHLFPVSYY